MDFIQSDLFNDKIPPSARNSIPSTLLTLLLAYISQEKYNPITKNYFKDEYDYVIVGAGTAGSAVASRLSELPFIDVLLLEAGDEAPPLSEVPSYRRFTLETEADWQYKTVPQENVALGLREQKLTVNAGKVLGGTTTINEMLHVRGNKESYAKWVELGAKGWGYEDMLPYFIKLEDNKDISQLDPGYHGIGGPVSVTIPKYNAEIKQPFLDACAAAGYPRRDYNGVKQVEIGPYQASIRNGRRCSTSKAYLVPSDSRENLDILKKAYATKILFDGLNAVGLQFQFGGALRTVKVRKEIILSAGVVQTPQLLMLSGIGPCEHLAEFNIPCIKNAPVGQNLQDHIGTPMFFTVNRTIELANKKDVDEYHILQYITESAGPLTTPALVAVIGFLRGIDTSYSSPDSPRQEVYTLEYVAEYFKNVLKPEVYNAFLKNYEGRPLYICYPSLLQPLSRGYVALNSSDPFDYPLINPRYYSDSRDLQEVIEGLKICQNLGASEQMQRVQSTQIKPLYPNCVQYLEDDDKRFECMAKTNIVSFYHLVGTARMGDPNDEKAVVDPDLRVIGVNNLRVVDASVIPLVPTGNTHVPVIAIAEKISDQIKQEIFGTIFGGILY